MDLSNPPNENKVSLLTIPRAELDSSGASSSPLLLLQLPMSWTAADLKDAHFVAQPSQQAALVVESKRCSFYVHRVETSNSLVMVPPPADDAPTPKRSKVTDSGKTLTAVPARLLKMGGSGACFLELREKSLSRIDLLAALRGCLFDPYDNKNKNSSSAGRTVSDLAASLQSSKYEIEQGLQNIQAYALPRSCPTEYCLLAEEALQECYAAIIAALSEAAGCDDYAGTGVQTDDFVTDVLERMSDDEKFPDADFGIRHCLQQLRTKSQSSSGALRLNVTKVAVCVARRLFQKQTCPWDEEVLFSSWQSELPGVGNLYQVKPGMLLGVAVRNEIGEARLWTYLPSEKLPTDPVACFDVLFAAKERWLLNDLEPYLDRLTDATPSTSQAELLLRFTKLVTEDRDGITLKLYQKK